MTNNQVLVTGGAGFIGSHMVETLLQSGHNVTIIDNMTTGRVANILHVINDVDLRIGDVRDRSLVHRCMESSKAVIHLAAVVGVQRVMKNMVETIDVNTTGTSVVLSEAYRLGIPVIVASSSEVYGKVSIDDFKETGNLVIGSSYISRWGYAASKLVDEHLARAYYLEYGLPTTVIRLFNVIGDRQSNLYGMVVPTFISQALTDQPITVHGNGNNSRCFCDVRDITAGIYSALNNGAAVGEIINLGSPNSVTIRNLAEKIKVMTGSNSEITYQPHNSVFGDSFEDMLYRIPKLDKAHELLNWRPEITLDDTLRSMIKYQRNQLARKKL